MKPSNVMCESAFGFNLTVCRSVINKIYIPASVCLHYKGPPHIKMICSPCRLRTNALQASNA